MIESVEFCVVGAGIAGAAAAHFLAAAGAGPMLIVEREAQPGYHSTGRSAATYFESYGPSQVRAMTLASRPFFEHPPLGFSEHPILTPRGALIVGVDGQQPLLDAHLQVVRSVSDRASLLSRAAALELAPILRADRVIGAISEPDAQDIDVHALHQGYLKSARTAGAVLRCGAEVTAIEADRAGWRIALRQRNEAGDWVDAKIRAAVLINAAGAWGDHIARLAGVAEIGLVPKRRSAMQFRAPAGQDPSRWPMLIGVDESWYIKPDAGLLIGSPANADPVAPHDVRPEELDIATAIERIEAVTTLRIRRPEHTWAGLRSFVADGQMVAGAAAGAANFIWFAALGGYGIQSSAAMGEAVACIARGRALPEPLQAAGITAAMLAPRRH